MTDCWRIKKRSEMVKEAPEQLHARSELEVGGNLSKLKASCRAIVEAAKLKEMVVFFRV